MLILLILFRREVLATRWWLCGVTSSKQSNSIIELLKALASGEISDRWTDVAKNAIAENVLALTRLQESLRNPDECVRTPTVRALPSRNEMRDFILV